MKLLLLLQEKSWTVEIKVVLHCCSNIDLAVFFNFAFIFNVMSSLHWFLLYNFKWVHGYALNSTSKTLYPLFRHEERLKTLSYTWQHFWTFTQQGKWQAENHRGQITENWSHPTKWPRWLKLVWAWACSWQTKRSLAQAWWQQHCNFFCIEKNDFARSST